MKIPKQEYTAELKELSIKCAKSGQSIGAVKKVLGLIEQTLHNWIQTAYAGKLNCDGCKVVTPDQMELSRFHYNN